MGSQHNNSLGQYQQTLLEFVPFYCFGQLHEICGYLQSSKNENENVFLSIWNLKMAMKVLVL